MTRLSTSRPKRSVPNGACALGFASIRSKFCSSGGTGASTPANSAMPMTTSAKTAPTITTGLRATRRGLFVAILRAQEPRRERRGVSRLAGRQLFEESLGRHVMLVVPKTVASEGQRMTLQSTLHEHRARQVGHVVDTHDDTREALRRARDLCLEPQELLIRGPAGRTSSPVQVAEEADHRHTTINRVLDPLIELRQKPVSRRTH